MKPKIEIPLISLVEITNDANNTILSLKYLISITTPQEEPWSLGRSPFCLWGQVKGLSSLPSSYESVSILLYMGK